MLVTKAYSTSFSLGILFLSRAIRKPIYSVYGFVRFADEIVDSFHGYKQRELLASFKTQTYEAIDEKISLNPILNSFQEAFHAFGIQRELIETFFQSMEMDLEDQFYDEEKYKQYILGSAEVVGLMCLHVFTKGDRRSYEELKPYAMKLGSAFQKVNFLRDVQADREILGRTYFPGVDLQKFTHSEKREIEREIEEDFKMAHRGIRMLPKDSRSGVYLAYCYYRALFNKIKDLPAEKILKQRVRVPNFQKILVMISSNLRFRLNML